MGLGRKCPSENQLSHTRLHGFPFDLVSSSFQLSRIISQVSDLHSNPYLRLCFGRNSNGDEGLHGQRLRSWNVQTACGEWGTELGICQF